MPELPEVETARAIIDKYALDRRIAGVDDTDAYVCRPHAPGDIRAALLGRTLTGAYRRGKSMWCETSGSGPLLGIHLGMSGKIVFSDSDGVEHDGGDYWDRGRKPGDHRFTRFALQFDDGTFMLLVDPRRLGRVRLDPPVEKLGPDAREITRAEFRRALDRSTVAVKARLLDQEAMAGIGNLLADQALWLAKINPAKPVDELSRPAIDRLYQAVHESVEAAIAGGGVHTLSVIPARRNDGRCPRCNTLMRRATVGGRTTYWCPKDQK
ncbi:Fpg/Nei family DNA glycosylase [Hamadaea tsunoensis]|uniref:Fpg/Nei family DNA glycosylase n=1 Tax=Hamadaea tsunoensis TaxID=53368 RepID=UPI0003F738AE|nr:DNA-formamidopyrimidine glycosylase family protein [Hamadaea tsunoensis]